MDQPSPHPFFELVAGLRACRSFTARPVADTDLVQVLDAATRAPSAENAQPWHFVVVRDETRRIQISEVMRGLWVRYGRDRSKDRLSEDVFAAVDDGFASGLVTAPVMVVVCGDREQADERVLPTSIYPAVQNLLLAAHALGLGSVLTTIATVDPKAIRKIIEAPDSLVPMAIIPIGHPATALGPSRRAPVTAKSSLDQYGQPWPG